MSTEQAQLRTRRAFGLLAEYVVRDRRRVLAATFWLALATAADVSGPMLAKVFIDDYLAQHHYPLQPLLWLLAAYLGTQVLATVLRFTQTLRFADLALNAVRDIRERVFAHVLRLPMAYHDTAITGQLVSRITNDTEAIKDLYVQFLSAVVANVVFLAGALVAMAILDMRLMIIAALLIPAVLVIIRIYEHYSGHTVERTRQLRSDINAQLNESIQGVRVIQAMGQESRFAGDFAETNNEHYCMKLRTMQIGALLLRPALDLIGIVILAAVLVVYGGDALGGGVEIGVLYAFVNYLSRFTEPLIEITQRFNLYQQAMVSGERLSRLLEEPLPAATGGNATVAHGAMAFEDVHFGYDPAHPVVHGISVSIAPGEFIGIVGHTGSGKSTLLNLLLGFYAPQQGRITLDDIPLSEYTLSARHRLMSLIPQEPFVQAGSLRDNIDMGRGIAPARLAQAVREAQLEELVTRLPQGLDSLLGERGTRLSTGERQLLAIARAMADEPRVLLLDEATANIDSETEHRFQQALLALRGRVSIIAIAHRLSTIRDADRILVMRHGRIVESGSHNELMARQEGYYRRLVLLQQEQEALAALET